MELSGEPIERLQVDYVPKNDRYLIKSAKYEKQYNKIYLKRLEETIEQFRKRATIRWAGVPILDSIIDSENKAHDSEMVLIGTLFKVMSLRASVIDDFSNNNGISGGVQSLDNIHSSKDDIIIEDNSGRASLGGPLAAKLVDYLVSGVGVAVKGYVEKSIFMVTDYLFVNDIDVLSEHNATTSPATNTSTKKTDKYVMFVSGLSVTAIPNVNDTDKSELYEQMLVDFLAGNLGDENDVQLASQIVKVIVTGNSVKPVDPLTSKERYANLKAQSNASAPSKQLDILLSQVVTNCSVDIMPGATDLATQSFPQQPLHTCLFPHCSRFSTFTRTTNPYEATLDDLLVVGTSGQPITDIARQTILPHSANAATASGDVASGSVAMDVDTLTPNAEVDESQASEEMKTTTEEKEKNSSAAESEDNTALNILKNTLRWSHLCPSVPDTLNCFPYVDRDPFLIKDTAIPSILFAGNQPEFATSLVVATNATQKQPKNTRLVCIPSFKLTGTVVLVNISRADLECSVINFK